MASTPHTPAAVVSGAGDDWLLVRLVPVARTPPSSVEPIVRRMYERGVLRLGRQVKSPQEKAMAMMREIDGVQTNADPAANALPAAHMDGNAAAAQHVLQHVSADAAQIQQNTLTQTPDNAKSEQRRMSSGTTVSPTSPKSDDIDNIPCVMPPSKIHENHDTTANNVWFKSKVVSRAHAELWLKDGQLYVKDIGSSSGTFLNKLRLSPAGKASRPYPIRDGDVIQLGVDYQSRSEDIYKAVELSIHIQAPATASSSARRHRTTLRFRTALRALLAATNPYSTANTISGSSVDVLATIQKSKGANSNSGGGTVDCCICITSIGPFQALFVAPCSHCFHYKCIRHILRDAHMFPCPVCRQTANLDASVSMESLFDYDDNTVDIYNGAGGNRLDATADIDSRTGDDVDDADDDDVDADPYNSHGSSNGESSQSGGNAASAVKELEHDVPIKVEGSLLDAIVKSEDTDMGLPSSIDPMIVDEQSLSTQHRIFT